MVTKETKKFIRNTAIGVTFVIGLGCAVPVLFPGKNMPSHPSDQVIMHPTNVITYNPNTAVVKNVNLNEQRIKMLRQGEEKLRSNAIGIEQVTEHRSIVHGFADEIEKFITSKNKAAEITNFVKIRNDATATLYVLDCQGYDIGGWLSGAYSGMALVDKALGFAKAAKKDKALAQYVR